MKYAIIDTETLRWSHEVERGWDKPEDFGLACACIKLVEGDKQRDGHYLPCDHLAEYGAQDDIANHFAKDSLTYYQFQKTLNEVDRIIVFNKPFDFGVLQGAGFDMSFVGSKIYDISEAVYNALGFRIRLADLAQHNLNDVKLMSDGGKAVNYWRSALQILLELDYDLENSELPMIATHDMLFDSAMLLCRYVIHYCKKDVDLTWRLYQHIIANEGLFAFWDKRLEKRNFGRVELPDTP